MTLCERELKLIPWMMVLSVSSVYSSQQTNTATDPLRAAVEMAFRAQHGVDFDELERLGDPAKVRGVLIEMLNEYRNPKDDTAGRFLLCTILAVGHLKERSALGPLANIAQDSALRGPSYELLRERAARSMG